MRRSNVESHPVVKADIDVRAAERIERNIDGVFDFLRTVAADPTIVEGIPDGAEIVLEHAADPALSAANWRASEKSRIGGDVYVHHVRGCLALPAEGSDATARFRSADRRRWLRRLRSGSIRPTKA